MGVCHACQTDIAIRDRVGRRDTCPHCNAELRCCLNCTFYDPHYADACREPNAEPVTNKERANFCDFFDFRRPTTPSRGTDAEARAQLEALFKKKE